MKGWTQADLATRVGVSRSAISMIEAGERVPKWKTFRMIEWVLGAAKDDLDAVGEAMAGGVIGQSRIVGAVVAAARKKTRRRRR